VARVTVASKSAFPAEVRRANETEEFREPQQTIALSLSLSRTFITTLSLLLAAVVHGRRVDRVIEFCCTALVPLLAQRVGASMSALPLLWEGELTPPGPRF
jgi:hypothetical protein